MKSNKPQYKDDRAVSPVIGVILMVAITVILAAVIGTFVLGIGQSAGQAAPQASMSLSAVGSAGNTATVTLEHNGGDAIHSDRTKVVVSESGGGSTTFEASSGDEILSVGGTAEFTLKDSGTPDELDLNSDGTLVYTSVDGNADAFQSGETVTVKLIDTETQKVIYERETTAG